MRMRMRMGRMGRRRRRRMRGRDQAGEVLDQGAVSHDASFAEEAEVDGVGGVEEVEHRVRVLVERRCEDHHLEQLPDLRERRRGWCGGGGW
eukprot:3820150-Rhodomonas_salina.1